MRVSVGWGVGVAVAVVVGSAGVVQGAQGRFGYENADGSRRGVVVDADDGVCVDLDFASSRLTNGTDRTARVFWAPGCGAGPSSDVRPGVVVDVSADSFHSVRFLVPAAG
ncbi:hypothetical protein ACN20G_35435 (plasmid) [Streptomyces sp. BI20]|uniref:hypothetical protein n=1 Tax=Streptomyces sp. BI20 TaxID=3403460 RepID=UPI003C70CD85